MIQATKRRVIWVDVTGSGRQMAALQRDFTAWVVAERIETAVRGHSGELGFSNGYTPHYANKVLAWLQNRGIEA